ncbi:YbjQ family protein [Salibaculum griseiflavum]|uniref:UPF0145 protein DFK10_14445 n=1 Tax=Salibaculum griseiflavum TaxID=1914409 RepID=A0A2V1NZW1_9RHOB|nr:YbjQ family protein [Salibaculum griseiflavum]PWG15853.1 YbjQ family protein [Salibaculum griseiflavum]
MTVCADCGKRLSWSQVREGGVCKDCFIARKKGGTTAEREDAAAERLAEIERILLTTETCPRGLDIIERLEVVTAECAFGMNVFKDLFAGIRDIVGGRSEAVQETLRESRRTALFELKKEANRIGANAVVAIDLDYVELSGAGNMVLLVASGTAVRIQPNEE